MFALQRIVLTSLVLVSLVTSLPVGTLARDPNPASVLSSVSAGAKNSVPPPNEPSPPLSLAPQAPSAVAAFQHSLFVTSTQYLSVSDSAALTPANAMTIEAWVRRAAVGCQTVVGKDYTQSYWLGFCNNKIRFYSGGLSTVQDGATNIPANVWTHIAVTWQSGGQRRYYINGELDYTGVAGAGSPDNAAPLYIGYDPSPCCNLAGNLAEVRLWSVARSQDDIRRTMHMALDEPRPGLVAAWHLSDDFKDSIGGHAATPQNGAALTGPQAPPRPALVPVDQYFGKLPATRYGAASAHIPETNRALLIGGVVGGSDSQAVDQVEVGAGSATNIATLGAPLIDAMAAYAPSSGQVYVFGGVSSTLLPRSRRSIYAIDPNTGALRTLAATLPVSASQGAAVYHAGLDKVYILGGINISDTGTSVLDNMSMFDPATESVTPITLTVPGGLRSFAAAYSSLTGKLYLFGGMDGALSLITTTYEIALQPDGLIGSIKPVSTAPLPRANTSMAAVEDPRTGLIYLLSGTGSDRVTVFDPATAQMWETLIQLPEARSSYAAAFDARNNQAIVMGGFASGAKREIWRIPLGAGPALAMGRWDFPQTLGSTAYAISGDETQVAVGTQSNGVYVYNANGSRVNWTAANLGSATGWVNDVRYDAANDHVWAATNDAGGKLITSTVTTFDSAALGTNQIVQVDMRPGYGSIDYAPFFGTYGLGLKWRAFSLFPLPGGYYWATAFPGAVIDGLAHRTRGDVWTLAFGQLARLIYTDTVFGTASVTTTYPYAASCDLLTPVDMTFDHNGDLWVVSPNTILLAAQGAQRPDAPAYGGQGICQILSPATAMSSQYRQPNIGVAAGSVDVDSDGRVWVSLYSQFGESGGLATYQNLSGTVRVAETNWLTGPVGSLVMAGGNTLWDSSIAAVGAADERVWASKPGSRLITIAPRWQQLDEVEGLAQHQATGVWTARGRLFVMASDAGLDPYLYVLSPDGQTWDKRSMTGAIVHAVMGDRQGRIWVGTDSGARLYTPTGWDMLTSTVGSVPTSTVYALAEDHGGRIWLGGSDGALGATLTLFDRERFVLTFNETNSNLPGASVTALLADRDNRLWIGTDNGLARLRDNAFEVFSTTHGLPSNAIVDLAQAGDGRVAVSTSSGLAFFDGASSFYTETLPVNINPSDLPLTVDDQGRLWAGGAVRNSGGWQGNYWTNSGLRSSTVKDNAADGAGFVWFAHYPDNGVSVRGTYLPPLGTVLPTVYSITPTLGSVGTVITITGSGFSDNPADVNVTIGGSPVGLLSASEGQLVVVANANTTSGDVSVNARGQRVSYTGSGGNRAFCAVPVLTSFSPTGGNDGVPITLRGTNFDPAARVILGGATEHLAFGRSPTEIQVLIEPGDGSGAVQVRNQTTGCPTFTATGATTFNRVGLSMGVLALNQGMPSYGLMAHRPTLVSGFLSRNVALRMTDRLEIDTVLVRFTDAGGNSVTRTIPYTGAVPSTLGAVSAAVQRDQINAVNIANVAPGVPDFRDGSLTTQVTLRRFGRTVAQAQRTDSYSPNRIMRVMLVPIMQSGYTSTELWSMRSQVDQGLEDVRRRIMPTGQVEFIWSPTVLTRDSTVALDDVLELYTTSHDMDRIRRRWNENSDRDALIAFGVVDGRLVTGNVTGYGFWPDASELINLLLADWVDLLCDVGNALLQIVSFGLFGSDDGCHLEIPLYVGWATGGDPQSSALFGHEFGHIMGLVKPWATNGAIDDNFSHSVNDELDGGECGGSGVTYNVNKTLYRQPGVSEPVVNPITGRQFRAQLSTQDDGSPANQNTLRGKAIMSYACNDGNTNVFYEPADVGSVNAMFGASSFLNFFHDLRPGSGLAAQSAALGTTALNTTRAPRLSNDIPVSRTVPGPRLYVSGLINKATNTGELRRVEALGGDAPLSASYATGYWLVQRDSAGAELSRVGLYPVFSSSAHASQRVQADSNTGFFAATLLRATSVVTLELRHDAAVLASFRAGASAPTVSLTSPSGGSYNSGDVPVTWTAGDADGDPLNIVVEYSANNGASWLPVAFVSGTVSATNVAVTQLAGSTAARMRVIAGDGFNTGVATSTIFSVAYQPPQPFINHPNTTTIALEGQHVSFAGGASDNQDGLVADANLHWRSHRDGALGTGSTFDTILSVGAHTITLEVANSVGLTAIATTTITVQSDYDMDGLPDSEELGNRLNPLTESDALSDADGDGLPLVMERRRGTNPNSSDSDGDGRSDADEIAAGTDPGTNDSPLPPDQLKVYPASLLLTASLALDTPLPQQHVQVVSGSPATWTVSADVGWLASSAISGSTPDNVTILADAYLLPDGVHRGRLTFASAELGSVVTVPVTLTVTDRGLWYDVNRDGLVNWTDVQEVAARVGTNNQQPGFSRRHDVDRDGDVDVIDLRLITDAVLSHKIYLPLIMR